jgi:SagB-type dehydrogenase family enzyme
MLPFLIVMFAMSGGESDIVLPAPSFDRDMSLEKAIHARRSTRSFSDTQISIDELSQILWAAQGITDTLHGHQLRASPSAGALYPLELYTVIPSGIYHYIPQEHTLIRVKSGDSRGNLCTAALSQSAISNAPLSIVVTAIYERATIKYAERGIRYVHIEVGHAAQNMLLQAVSLGLTAVPIGAFNDDKVQEVLGCSTEETPLYIIPIGRPD